MIISDGKDSKLSKKDLSIMANVMSSAFLNHANFIDIIPFEKKRKKALYHLFIMMYKVINQYGYIYIVKDSQAIGYITFMDAFDQKQISVWRVLKTKGLRNFLAFLFTLKSSEIIKFLKYMKVYNAYHKTMETKDVVHLYSTGVIDSHKGKGHMGKAIRECYTYFKGKGYKKMILETSDESNLPIYHALGFTETARIPIPNSKLQIYFFEIII